MKLGPRSTSRRWVLPLVDNTLYTGLRQMYAGAPAGLARQGESGKTIAAIRPPSRLRPRCRRPCATSCARCGWAGVDPWRWLGDQATLVIYDGDPFLTVDGNVSLGSLGRNLSPISAALATGLLSSLTLPTALVVKVKDPETAREALNGSPSRWRSTPRSTRGARWR